MCAATLSKLFSEQVTQPVKAKAKQKYSKQSHNEKKGNISWSLNLKN